MALIRKGKQAIMSAFRAHQEIRSGQLAKASTTLSHVKMDGTKLAKEAEELMTRIKAVEVHYIKKEEAISRKIGQLQDEEQRLREEKRKINNELSQKRLELNQQRRSLQEAEEELSRSKREEEEARNKKEGMIAATVVAGVGGVIFSIATLGLGTPVAVAAVAGCTIAAVNYAEQQEKAERNIRRSREVIGATEREIKRCTERISQIERDTNYLTQQIEEQEQEASYYHEERGEMKNLIVFVKEAQVYWNEFADAMKHGASRAELLENLTKKAQEKRFFGFFARRAGKRQAMSFLEAWEDIQSKVKSGSEHLFQVDFECSRCGCSFRSLPYARNMNLVCSSCHR